MRTWMVANGHRQWRMLATNGWQIFLLLFFSPLFCSSTPFVSPLLSLMHCFPVVRQSTGQTWHTRQLSMVTQCEVWLAKEVCFLFNLLLLPIQKFSFQGYMGSEMVSCLTCHNNTNVCVVVFYRCLFSWVCWHFAPFLYCVLVYKITTSQRMVCRRHYFRKSAINW